MIFNVLFGLIGLALGAAATYIWAASRLATLRERLRQQDNARQEMGDTFGAAAKTALQDVQKTFLDLAQERLAATQKDGAHDLEKRQIAIGELIKPLQKHLEILGSTVEQIKGTDLAMREDLKNLSRETAKLAGALRDPTAQGRWGEYILEGLMENSGLIRGVHFETQVTHGTSGQRPDVIVNLSDNLKIVIDAKTPLNEFANNLGQSMSEDESALLMKNLAAQVKLHIGTLSKKGYWQDLDADSVDFTVLFLPSEPLFSMALRGDPGLVDLAASKNVIIASPILMMALLRVIKMGWRQADLATNARAISDQGAQLYTRLNTFVGHLDKVSRGLGSAVDGYNSAVGSLNQMVMPAARKLQEMGVQDSGKNIVDLTLIEIEPRRLTGTSKDS